MGLSSGGVLKLPRTPPNNNNNINNNNLLFIFLSSSSQSSLFPSLLTSFLPPSFPTQLHLNKQHPCFTSCSSSSSSSSTLILADDPPLNNANRKPDSRRRRPTAPPLEQQRKRYVRLSPPSQTRKLEKRFLASPQLTLPSYPLLSSCLPPANLSEADHLWIQQYIPRAKAQLGLFVEQEEVKEGTPLAHLDTLLFLAFQHEDSERSVKAHYVRTAHSRLWFLGQFVLELVVGELLLQIYPRDPPAGLRERAFGLTRKALLPKYIKNAKLDSLIFPDSDFYRLKRDYRESTVKLVFWALIGAIYLTLGVGEVYQLLFEVFGFDLNAIDCQPKVRSSLEDEDHLSPELDQHLSWQDIAAYEPPADALFAHPRLYRACVPTGMHRFRGNFWERESLPYIMNTLGYPLQIRDENPEMTAARIVELKLGLQLSFMHPSRYKGEHPRFCLERLEYLGQRIQDVIMAERLLMKHFDGPGLWFQGQHRKFLMNRLCGLYLREKKLHHFIIYHDEKKTMFENRRLRNFATISVQQALHGAAYLVYGRAEVWRLMFNVFDFEQLQPRL